MTGQDIYAGALLTAVESLLGGTTINTMYHYESGGNELSVKGSYVWRDPVNMASVNGFDISI